MEKLVSVSKKKDAVVLKILPPKLVAEDDIEALYDEIMKEIPVDESVNLIIDFENVEFISTGFLGQLTSIRNSLVNRQGRLVLCAIRPAQLEIFRVTHLENFFELADDVEAAMLLLEKPPRV